MPKFQDQIIVVTGGTRGIGKAIAAAFAQEGAISIILGRNHDTVSQAVDEITKNGGKADGFACDVTNLENVKEIINKILDKHSHIDTLVNNAGITKDNLLLRMSADEWDDVLRVNLRGVFNCTKVVSKAMLKARRGRIINISSIIGITGNIGQANYAASKAGIIGFTKSIALEYASRGITANAIAPGYIRTEMTAQLSESATSAILGKIPMNRLGTAKDVAGVCLFLASKDANYITGQTVVVDGGMSI